jgi:hypothetical protein
METELNKELDRIFMECIRFHNFKYLIKQNLDIIWLVIYRDNNKDKTRSKRKHMVVSINISEPITDFNIYKYINFLKERAILECFNLGLINDMTKIYETKEFDYLNEFLQ